MMLRTLAFPMAVLVFGATSLTAGGQTTSAPPQPAPPQPAAMPPGAGLDLINDRCGFCHSTGQVFEARKAPVDWSTTVQAMVDRGAELTPDEQKTVVGYLSANFATGTPAPPAKP